jgi:integrase
MKIENYTPPSKQSKRPLDAQQTDQFYNAAVEVGSYNLQDSLAGRTLLDFGLRVGEFTHITPSWVDRERHPKAGNLEWRIKVPMGEHCTSGTGPTGEGNEIGANLHETDQPCKKCRNRSYEDKDWVDDEFHSQYPFHPKTGNSIGKTWALPTDSCEETARLLREFLEPGRQWPVGPGPVNDALERIRQEAGLDRAVKAHALRHTYGCRLAAAGKNLQAIMAQMRHGSLAMAQYYSELRGTRVRDQIREDWDANEDF